jgi:hypothetical protein
MTGNARDRLVVFGILLAGRAASKELKRPRGPYCQAKWQIIGTT